MVHCQIEHVERVTTTTLSWLSWFCRLSLLYNTHNTNIHAPSRIRTRNPSKLSAADPRLRPLGHRDRQILSPDRPVRSQLLYLQSYPGPQTCSTLLGFEPGNNPTWRREFVVNADTVDLESRSFLFPKFRLYLDVAMVHCQIEHVERVSVHRIKLRRLDYSTARSTELIGSS